MKFRFSFFFFLLIILIAFGIFIIVFFNPGITGNAVNEPYSEPEVYFCPREMCLERMLRFLDDSQEIKCAFYDLDIPELIAKLEEKDAEVVIEDSNKLEEFHSGYSFALMHNKFCVLDSGTVITGSMNPTVNDNYNNNNNLVILNSKTLARNYLDEFYELKKGVYGKGDKTKNNVVFLGKTKIENYFCPEDNCKLHVINAIKEADSSVYFMAFSFTDEDIGNLLWNKQYEGKEVKGIFDESQTSDYSRYEDLKEFSIIDKNKYKLHHKVFIIDNETVITGSFNPSANANEKNDENVIIIHDKGIAKRFAYEFNFLWNHEERLPGKTSGLIITKILYDAHGKDDGNELVELKNVGKEKINLAYYSLSDNKTNSRLSGILLPDELIVIKPKFSLKNKNGILILRHNDRIIDYAMWDGAWGLKAKESEFLIRTDASAIGVLSWTVQKQ